MTIQDIHHISIEHGVETTEVGEAMSIPLLVTSYHGPDLDGVAGSFAYAELLRARGRDAVAAILGTPHPEAKHVAERFGIKLPGDVDPRRYQKIVLIDTSFLSHQDPRLPIERVVEIIDHRKFHQGHKFPNAVLHIDPIGAAATLVAERFAEAKITPSRDAAVLLFGGIVSNTVNFKTSTTTDRDRRMAAWLKALYPLPDDFVETMFRAKSNLAGDKLRETILADYAWQPTGTLRLGIGQLEMVGAKQLVDERYDELIAIMQNIRQISPESERIFFSILDIQDGYNIFLAPEADVRQILSTILNVTFDNRHLAYRPGILMRKEIRPLWLAWVEKTTR